jgi:hypothetical protein
VQWFLNHSYAICLYGATFLTSLAAVLGLISVEKERRALALGEIRQAVRWGMTSWVHFGQRVYASNVTDELLESMGWRPYINGANLKITRDGLTIVLLLMVWFSHDGEQLVRPLIWVLVFYLTLTPGPGPFYLFIRPLFQRIHRYRVNRDTALLIQLLRNEMQAEIRQSVIALIRDYRPYMTTLKEDLFWLEHEWRNGKEEALERWERKHPANEDIRFLCSMFRKLDSIGYDACAEMLARNESTLNQRQVAQYVNKMQDMNRFLFLINVTGVILACLWFVMAIFLWAYDLDTGL